MDIQLNRIFSIGGEKNNSHEESSFSALEITKILVEQCSGMKMDFNNYIAKHYNSCLKNFQTSGGKFLLRVILVLIFLLFQLILNQIKKRNYLPNEKNHLPMSKKAEISNKKTQLEEKIKSGFETNFDLLNFSRIHYYINFILLIIFQVEKSSIDGLKTGIYNTNDSCYANSVIQAILSTNSLKRLIKESQNKLQELSQILDLLQSKKYVVVPNIHQINDNQKDALGYFRRIIEQTNINKKGEDFYFQFEITCNCTKKKMLLDYVNTLSYQSSGSLSSLLTKEEIFICSKCNSSQKRKVVKYPKTAIFCLKKDSKKIANSFFDEDELENLKIGEENYWIKSVVKHENNHFYCVTRDGDKWFKVDDEQVCEIEKSDILDENLYLIFSKKIKVKFFFYLVLLSSKFIT